MSALPSTDRATAWRKWRALSGADRLRLVALLASLPAMDVLLRVLGLRRTQRLLRLHLPARRFQVRITPDVLAAAQRLAELAAIAGSHAPLNSSCLRQSLIVQCWLRLRGLNPQLRIGARKASNTVDAHAWVELDSYPLAQPNLSHTAFVPETTRPKPTSPRDEAD